MKKDYIETALTTFAVLAGIFAIFLAVWYLVGDSPTENQVGFGLIGIVGSWLIILTYKFGKFEGKSLQFEKNVKDSFDRVKEDLHRIETKIDAVLKK